jgi:hypothetical protein
MYSSALNTVWRSLKIFQNDINVKLVSKYCCLLEKWTVTVDMLAIWPTRPSSCVPTRVCSAVHLPSTERCWNEARNTQYLISGANWSVASRNLRSFILTVQLESWREFGRSKYQERLGILFYNVSSYVEPIEIYKFSATQRVFCHHLLRNGPHTSHMCRVWAIKCSNTCIHFYVTEDHTSGMYIIWC